MANDGADGAVELLMPAPEEAAGWYPDPYEQAVERHWTGHGWGAETRPRALRATVVAPAPDDLPAAPDKAGTTAAAGSVVAAGHGRRVLWPVVSIGAGSAMAVGSFLTWATVSGTFGQHAGVRGVSDGGHGWISFVCGLAIVVAGVASFPRPRRVATIVVDLGALAACFLTIYEFVHLTSQTGVLSASNALGIYDVGLGRGLGLVAVASVVSLIGAAGITGRDGRATLER
ncbi:MAG: DUF2510 domain-containing protein [Actinomycetota bacterium]|nr:DUF2510 domain-containing protein [Actinomycetota bacterium]